MQRAGDVAAAGASTADWERLYERLRPTLLRALIGVTGSYEGVDDAIQDAFEQAIRKAPEAGNLEGWLYTVALNRLRRGFRLAKLGVRLTPRNEAMLELDQAAMRIDLVRSLARLSRRERELLVAKYYVGMSQEEIASALGLPRGTISAAIARAAARFREIEGGR